ncbi:MAG TPA: hypothetical protein VH062_03150 [Polyangiaceae bacterium]|nr:hypothetical protein [Polyangiaceae bacterium]
MEDVVVLDRARFQRVALGASLVAAVVLCVPSLGSGLQTEDVAHLAASRSSGGWTNLFGNGATSAADVYAMKDSGALPWITSDDFSLSLWRPLASITHHLDYRFWPDRPVLMHVQSVCWLIAAILGASMLFRRLSSGLAAATLATAFYAIDDGHGFVVGWLANRNALVAAAFAFPALVAHDRWRRDGWRPGGVVAGVLAWTALQGGEIAAGAFGYAAAHVLFLDPAPWRRRWVPLVPWVVAGLAWLVPYRALGYGARGSGAYVDPLSAPRDFIVALGTRLPALLFADLTGSPAERANFDFPWGLAIAVVSVGVISVGAVAWLRRDARARFWLAGMFLATLPACGTYPGDRLLVVAALGGMALAGELVAAAFGLAVLPRARWARVVATLAGLLLVLSDGVAAVSVLPAQSMGPAFAQSDLTRLTTSAYEGATPHKDLVLLNGVDFYDMGVLGTLHAATSHDLPAVTRVLYGGLDPITVVRTSDNELTVTAPHSFVAPGMNRVYRGLSRPLHPGDGLQLTRMRYVVQKVDTDGMPTVVTFTFATSLDDTDAVVLKRWNGALFLPFVVPPVGGGAVVGPGIG